MLKKLGVLPVDIRLSAHTTSLPLSAPLLIPYLGKVPDAGCVSRRRSPTGILS